MKDHEDILSYLQKSAESLEIPESIQPENVRKAFKQQEAQNAAVKRKKRKHFYQWAAAAASICLAAGITLAVKQPWNSPVHLADTESVHKEAEIIELAEAGMKYPKISYEDIYASMSKIWEEEAAWIARGEEGAAMNEAPIAEESFVAMEKAEKPMDAVADLEDGFGETNVQTAGVDEGDIVKNDGRYLYQKIWTDTDNGQKQVIQIIDTKDGLKEVTRIEDFESVEEFYVWEDILVSVESKYMDAPVSSRKGMIACCDVAYFESCFHEISFYNIADRSSPEKIKTFTLQGNYASSRVADGYFYGFSKYHANQGEGSKDYDAYVPKVDGIRLSTEDIYLSEDSEGTTYLVLVAIDLRNPTEFTDTTGIVAGSELYYVSESNIYVAHSKPAETEQGWSSDMTELLRFSYDKGRFTLRAEGEVPGSFDDSFSLDEFEGYLRVVSTVREYNIRPITDDRTGETLGSYIDEERQTNALYVLDENLKIVGKIEGLAENEQIYSARFLGNTGYFVTFRQTDPLFAVDLKDPENPEILSELKVSGFSEYLHGYGDGRLFGLGIEADEETGAQKGMKLSMFDISDEANVQEISRYPLEHYNHSEALYNHRALMISPVKNIIGFEAEGSEKGEYWKEYLIFSYENETFVEKIKISTKDDDGRYDSVRGTYIGNIFYLLCGDGSVKSYDLNTGEAMESLEP